MANIKVSPEEMREAAGWMDNQKERMLDAIREAKNKIDHLVENSYDTPQSKAKFAPMWENYQRELELGVNEMQRSPITGRRPPTRSSTPTTRRPQASTDPRHLGSGPPRAVRNPACPDRRPAEKKEGRAACHPRSRASGASDMSWRSARM
ncbi:hypothetical protein [Streptomyces sp. NPDC056938]|uniref:hypothetical protein n=1 Tax=unclassified Streptomyces TaxID=2593676 RepID=UPI003626E0C7